MKAIELKKLLDQAHELCPGMTLLDYEFADYLAANLDERVSPTGVVMTLGILLDDITKYKYDHHATLASTGMPDLIRRMYNAALAQAPHILQIIDAVTEPEFASETRKECKKAFGWQ